MRASLLLFLHMPDKAPRGQGLCTCCFLCFAFSPSISHPRLSGSVSPLFQFYANVISHRDLPKLPYKIIPPQKNKIKLYFHIFFPPLFFSLHFSLSHIYYLWSPTKMYASSRYGLLSAASMDVPLYRAHSRCLIYIFVEWMNA